MYNEEIKRRFICEYTQSESSRAKCVERFNKLEKFERLWGADICTASIEQATEAVNSIVGIRRAGQYTITSMLDSYSMWCISNKIPNASTNLQHLGELGMDKIKRQMVSSPLHLQYYLDQVFSPESDENIDNVYRAYFWLAFGGVYENDVLKIKNSDVDFNNFRILYNDSVIPIYPEGLAAFRNCCTLTGFKYTNPTYSDNVWLIKSRVPGDTILRGIQKGDSTGCYRGLMVTISRKIKKSVDLQKTNIKLSYNRAWLSGMFYRTYERERAGFPVDFKALATDVVNLKSDNSLSSDANTHIKINRVANNYLNDYKRWKRAYI